MTSPKRASGSRPRPGQPRPGQQDPVKPLPASGFGWFLESLGPWRNTLLLAVGCGLLFAGSYVDSVRPIEAAGLALALPLAAIGLGIAPLRDAPRPLLVLGVLIGLGAAAAIDREIWVVLFPPPAFASASLTEGHPDADLAMPSDAEDFEVLVRGQLIAKQGAARGHYGVVFTRGSTEKRLTGDLEREITYGRVGRRGTARVPHATTHEVRREPIEIRGRGPVHAHLRTLTGLTDPLRVSFFEAPALGWPLLGALGAMLALALALQAFAARRGVFSHFAAGVGAAAVLLVYLTYLLEPDDPLPTVFIAIPVSAATGGLGGFLLGALAMALASRRAEKPGPARAPADRGRGTGAA